MGYIQNIRKKVGHDAIFMPASACGIIKDNKILLQKRTDNGYWAIHGGGLELGETYLEGLERELREELNIKPLNPQLVGVYSGKEMHHIYPNKDEVYVVSVTYLVEDYVGTPIPDKDEVSEVKWFSLNKLPKEIHEPDIRAINDLINYYKKNREE